MLECTPVEARSSELELPYAAFVRRQRHQANPAHRWGAGGSTFELNRAAPSSHSPHVPLQLYTASDYDLRAGSCLLNQSHLYAMKAAKNKEVMQPTLRPGWGRTIRSPSPYIQKLPSSPFQLQALQGPKPFDVDDRFLNHDLARGIGRVTHETPLICPKATPGPSSACACG